MAFVLSAAGCGDDASRPGSEPDDAATTCTAEAERFGTADIDGDGSAEPILDQRVGTSDCPAGLYVDLDGHAVPISYGVDQPVGQGDVRTVRIAGREGDLVLIRQSHPRGGVDISLAAYDGAAMSPILPGGEPVFLFLAQDTTPTYYATARCTGDGFEVTEALPHEPIGVMPAWDVFRTTYTVAGAEFARGEREEIADNVLDEELQKKYSDLVDYRLFENCEAPAE